MRFTADDFRSSSIMQLVFGVTPAIECHEAAVKAQALFDAWLEAQPVVYGHTNNSDLTYFDRIKEPRSTDTHRARLVAIEAIQKKPCEHEPAVFCDEPKTYLAKCKHCGVKLKAKWEEA